MRIWRLHVGFSVCPERAMVRWVQSGVRCSGKPCGLPSANRSSTEGRDGEPRADDAPLAIELISIPPGGSSSCSIATSRSLIPGAH